VGLLGLPNAAKSTLISVVSAARPKIADYPFTTLVPNLGVVRLSHDQSFVIADVPGLIEGAAGGAGLGVQFLKHLSRTRLLLHLIDVAPMDGSDPVTNCRAIEDELARYSEGIADKTRWLVFTKVDLLDSDSREGLGGLAEQLGADKYFTISAVANEGTDGLMGAIAEFLAQLAQAEDDERILRETHEYSLRKRQERWQKRYGASGETDEGDDDDHDVSVHYEP
jgi:GTP-binding protein